MLVHMECCVTYMRTATAELTEAGSMYMQARKEAAACMSMFRHSKLNDRSAVSQDSRAAHKSSMLRLKSKFREHVPVQEQLPIISYPLAWQVSRTACRDQNASQKALEALL